jgi:hypothetical protein
MNFKSTVKTGVALCAIAALAVVACKKTSTSSSLTSADDNGGYASDAAKLESTGNSVMSIADNAATASGANLRTTGCATITRTYSGGDTTVTIDFGSGCTGFDGKTRSGQLIVTFNGAYKATGTTRTITSNNYKVDGLLVAVHKTVVNEGTNASGQDYYTVTVADSIYLSSDSVISWSGNRTRTWISGYNTAEILDDSYSIAGTTVVTRANGHVFTFAIESGSPLIVANDCPYIEAGTVDITGSSLTYERILDYGDTPNCDANATLTINGHVYNILLH